MQSVTPEFLLSQLRVALVAVLAYGGGRGWFTPADTTLYLALISSVGPLIAPWIWSIYSTIGMHTISVGSAAAKVAAVEKTDPVAATVGASAATQAAKA